ncbi:MAG: MOSC domain-containing protein [Alphaproteobacteria bacterium]|nr:MOSC domain-containing protein [Alphaproteobacteria bacterium]
MTTVARICRYPVKGLDAQDLDLVLLRCGAGLPHDRAFAIAHGGTRLDDGTPGWQPKDRFLMLMRNARLARLRTEFDDNTGTLTILRDGKQVARGNLTEPLGRQLVEQFLAAYFGDETHGAPKIVSAPEVSFTDTPDNFVSLVNLASVEDIERVVRHPVDPLRFRANLYIDSASPWIESNWPARRLAIGTAILEVVESIERCAATNVNPDTAERDLNIPKSLMDGFRHVECGIYARVVEDGRVAIGDGITIN